ALSPLGPRLGVPSVVAARAALGIRGAALVAVLLYVTNFAWIAVNNVIAASACSRLAGGPGSEKVWAVALGLLATAVVLGGPRLVGLADRVAVPMLLLVGVMLTIACLRLPKETLHAPGSGGVSFMRGLDVVVGYQVSWLLMFADYSRYTRSAVKGTAATFLGLALTSLWFVPLGFLAARAAGSSDPGAMVAAVGLGGWGALLLTLATLTTNFVNIYLSALAWKSLVPKTSDTASILAIGVVGAALSLSSVWLESYASFMVFLGALLVPVGGVLLAHFFVRRIPTEVAWLYDERGPLARHGGFSWPGLLSWGLGAAAYVLATPIGGTLPALVVSVAAYALLARRPGAGDSQVQALPGGAPGGSDQVSRRA
ncbi:MAG TPA: cytosine permease, partial [Thermoanaerobaculia bacterium]|nr:cytosine permease [Thermoanaerobaculia bacterium]